MYDYSYNHLFANRRQHQLKVITIVLTRNQEKPLILFSLIKVCMFFNEKKNSYRWAKENVWEIYNNRNIQNEQKKSLKRKNKWQQKGEF